MKRYYAVWIINSVVCIAALISALPAFAGDGLGDKPGLEVLQARIDSFAPDSRYKDDPYALVTLQEAVTALRSNSGGIGACLVDEHTGKVIERGRNRQYTSYFRSDLHAEMDLLNRYEDRLKKIPGKKGGNPRECEGIVLYSSVEPCPMCLTRIINSGIKKVYYVAADQKGGMVTRMNDLPPFWRNIAQGRDFSQAVCSPELREIANELFHYAHRDSSRIRGKN